MKRLIAVTLGLALSGSPVAGGTVSGLPGTPDVTPGARGGPSVTPGEANINLSSFGVVCDGARDNSAAIAAALTAFPAGRVRYIWPSGTCSFATPIAIHTSNTYLAGQGTAATVLKYTGAGAGGVAAVSFSSVAPSTVSIADVGLDHLTIQGGDTSADTDTGLQFLFAGNTAVNDVRVQYFFVDYEVAGGNTHHWSSVTAVANTAYTSLRAGSAAFWGHSQTDGARYHVIEAFHIANFDFRTGITGAGFTNYGFLVTSADGFHVSNGYVGGFVTGAEIKPEADRRSAVVSADFKGVRWDYGGGPSAFGQVDCVRVDNNGGNPNASIYGFHVDGGTCGNRNQKSGHGIVINSPSAKATISGVFINPTLLPIYAPSFSDLTITGNDIFGWTSGTGITTPAHSTFNRLTITGNTVLAGAGGATAVSLGSVAAGTPVAVITGNNYGNTRAPEAIDATVDNLTDCGNVSSVGRLTCTLNEVGGVIPFAVTGEGTVKHGGASQLALKTVATLPICNGSAEGMEFGDNDLLAPTFLAAAVGGGTVHGKVYCNGTKWVTD